ncbi:MAG: hypothetical protein AAF251_00635 [Pseudomonadota bacterium]
MNYLLMVVGPFALYFLLRDPETKGLSLGICFLVAFAVLFFPFEYWRYLRRVRRDFESERGGEDTVVFEWNDEGFSVTTSDHWQRYKWEDFVCAIENERFIKLYSTGTAYPAFVFKWPMDRSQIDDIKLRTRTLGSVAVSFL